MFGQLKMLYNENEIFNALRIADCCVLGYDDLQVVTDVTEEQIWRR
jgi:CRP-like cAMP-binding protein